MMGLPAVVPTCSCSASSRRARLQRVLRGHEEAHDPALRARLHRHGGGHGDRLRRPFHRYRRGHRHRRALAVLGEDKVRQRHERRILSVLDAHARPHVGLGGQPRAIPPNLDGTDRVDDVKWGLFDHFSFSHDLSHREGRDSEHQRRNGHANTADDWSHPSDSFFADRGLRRPPLLRNSPQPKTGRHHREWPG